MEYRTGSHTKHKLEYHFVWATKYRYQVLTGDIKSRVRELIRQTCESMEVSIVKGVVSVDHVHILVSCPPGVVPAELMKRVIRAKLEVADGGVRFVTQTVLGSSFVEPRIFLRHGWKF